jgi:hypothetical protein
MEGLLLGILLGIAATSLWQRVMPLPAARKLPPPRHE